MLSLGRNPPKAGRMKKSQAARAIVACANGHLAVSGALRHFATRKWWLDGRA